MSYSPTEIASIQNELRQSVLAQRQILNADEVHQKSKAVCERFLDFLGQNASADDFNDQVIALYRCKTETDGELNPSALLKSPLFTFAHFAFPRILSFTERTMDFAIPLHSSDWWVPKTLIPEPKADLPTVDPNDIGLIVVPGVVFSNKGFRVGRGAGFYDRFLKDCKGAMRVGLAYDFQLSEKLSDSVTAPWDEPLDILVTESKLFEF